MVVQFASGQEPEYVSKFDKRTGFLLGAWGTVLGSLLFLNSSLSSHIVVPAKIMGQIHQMRGASAILVVISFTAWLLTQYVVDDSKSDVFGKYILGRILLHGFAYGTAIEALRMTFMFIYFPGFKSTEILAICIAAVIVAALIFVELNNYGRCANFKKCLGGCCVQFEQWLEGLCGKNVNETEAQPPQGQHAASELLL